MFTLGEEDHQAAVEAFRKVPDDRIEDRLDVGGRRQVAAQVVEAGGLDFPFADRFGPFTGLGNKGTDDHPDREECEKG